MSYHKTKVFHTCRKTSKWSKKACDCCDVASWNCTKGSGKTSLATRLAATWNCQLINGASSVEQAIRDETELGNEVCFRVQLLMRTNRHFLSLQARELLLKGEAVPSSLVAEIIEEKIQSPEVEHYGMCNIRMLKCLNVNTCGFLSPYV